MFFILNLTATSDVSAGRDTACGSVEFIAIDSAFRLSTSDVVLNLILPHISALQINEPSDCVILNGILDVHCAVGIFIFAPSDAVYELVGALMLVELNILFLAAAIFCIILVVDTTENLELKSRDIPFVVAE